MANPIGAKSDYTDSFLDFHCLNSQLHICPRFIARGDVVLRRLQDSTSAMNGARAMLRAFNCRRARRRMPAASHTPLVCGVAAVRNSGTARHSQR
ncbi:unnamed protein product [Mycetohabitans rhizoxinica HKI 454]|uniref:Uncharacterized protein n=1 Tax=Mycetohabitans rhizoxinica (strain DSM 19002 / CIP 109453 / HKI 454) TaxID=882378 RepID=E5AR19_MYCRK|nr:unnamed protein product [Mycetohabitans rhizoxinica HKI 454]